MKAPSPRAFSEEELEIKTEIPIEELSRSGTPLRVVVGISLAAGALCLALSFCPGLLLSLAAIDHGTTEKLFALRAEDLTGLMRLYAAVCPLLGAMAGLLLWRWRVRAPGEWLRHAAITVCTSTTLFLLLTRLGYEGTWYSLSKILRAPDTMEVFGRRLLLVWPAQWLYQHASGLTPLRTYYVMQAGAILATMIVVAAWSAKFAGRKDAYVGQLLLIVMLAPTLGYHNYYDIFVVGTFAAALLCLWERRYILFSVLTGVGTLNHENALLLVFVAAAVCYERETVRKTAFVAVKAGISLAVPMSSTFHFRIITNLWELAHEPGAIGLSLAGLFSMCLCTALGWRSAAPGLRRSALFLMIPLFAVTFLFGKFREPRQFDAFIPLAIAFALSAMRQGRKAQGQPADAALAEAR
jgi:hypothetical protein